MATLQSNTAILTVTPLTLVAVTQPTDKTARLGDPSPVLYFGVEGRGPFTYQWYDASDDSVVPGATGASYALPTNDITLDGSTYYCIATDIYLATVQSSTVTYTVRPALLRQTVDVRIKDMSGKWVSIIGEQGDPADGSQLIADARIRWTLTWSSAKIAQELGLRDTRIATLEAQFRGLGVTVTGGWSDSGYWSDAAFWNDGV